MDLSERLASLGMTPNQPETGRVNLDMDDLEGTLGGRIEKSKYGQVLVVEKELPLSYSGQGFPAASLDFIGKAAGYHDAINYGGLQDYVVLDTETTGLMGGAGTLVFLVGLGRFTPDTFTIIQYLSFDPRFELAQLFAVERMIQNATGLITYNGKTFDLPLLKARFKLHLQPYPFGDLIHLDLLHVARRLWRRRLASRSLRTVEAEILNIERSTEDIPGWLIPDIYHQFLLAGDPQPLQQVLYHNQMDVYSLGILFQHITSLFSDPFGEFSNLQTDWSALARFYIDAGELDRAIDIFTHGIERTLDPSEKLENLEKLAFIYKKLDNYPKAIECWETAASLTSIRSHIELAKYFEHVERNFKQALDWTQTALQILSRPDFHHERILWEDDLMKRSDRLTHKIEKQNQIILKGDK